MKNTLYQNTEIVLYIKKNFCPFIRSQGGMEEEWETDVLGVPGSSPILTTTFFSIFILRVNSENWQKFKCTFLEKKNENYMQKKFIGFPCRICRNNLVKFTGISL